MVAEWLPAPQPMHTSVLAPALAGGDSLAFWEDATSSHLLPRSVLVPSGDQPVGSGKGARGKEPEQVAPREVEPAAQAPGQRADAAASPKANHKQPQQWLLHAQALAKQLREQHEELLARLELLEVRQRQQQQVELTRRPVVSAAVSSEKDLQVLMQAVADQQAQLRVEVAGMLTQHEERLMARMGRCLSEFKESAKDPVSLRECRPQAHSQPKPRRTASAASSDESCASSRMTMRRHSASCDLPLAAGVLQQGSPDRPKLARRRRLLFASLAVILANMAVLGLEMDVSIDAARNRLERPEWVFWLNMLFTAYYTVELVARFALDREAFCSSQTRGWNIVDFLLVLTGWADTVFDVLDLSALRILRVHLALRSFRILRFLGSLRRLRLVVSACIRSLCTALWAFVFVGVVLYMFAVLILQGVEQYARTPNEPSDSLYEYYGSVGRTMACLFMAITGGREWGVLVEPLREVSSLCAGLFVFYIAFAFVFLANVLTAVFVERASELAKADSDLALLEEYDQNRQVAARIRDSLRSNRDEDGQSPIIGKRELEWLLQDARVMEPISALGLDAAQVLALYDLMANEELGGVDREELAHALTRLKSSANCGGIATLMFENQRMNKQIFGLIRYLEHEFAELSLERDRARSAPWATRHSR